MRLKEDKNDKAPRRGLDGARGKPYSRICRRGPVTIADGELVVKFHSTSQLGNSGRGNNAQNFLKSRPGQRASRRAAHRREARTATGKPVKSRRQQDGSEGHNSA
jgi:hypothetical protein